MTGVSAQFLSGDGVTPGLTAGIPCFIDVCSGGVVGNFYAFALGNLVTDQLGGGPLADQVLSALANSPSGTVYAIPATPTWGGAPSVTHVGTGPTVTCAVANGFSGPLDFHSIVFAPVSAGANGVAQMSAAYDGSTVIETFTVPAAQSAVLTGTAPITPTALALASGLTLVFDAPASATLTFASPSLGSSGAGLMAATATIASPHTYHASDLLTAGVAAILANPRTLTFATAGTTPAHVPPTIVVTGTDYSGATQSETVVPDTSAGSVTTTKVYATITSLAYAAAGGTDATIAIGYGSAYASVTELVAEANTLAAAAPLAVTASDAQSSSGHFLAFTSTATGTGAAVTMDASPGTGATLLGFAASATASGLAATFTPPWTGLTFTFATGSYVVGDTYTATPQGPTASISAITAAMAVGRANWRQSPFGFFAITAPPGSASNSASLQAAVSSTLAPWRTDQSCPVWAMCPTVFHTASSNPTTNAANITTADNALVAAFAGNTAALDLVAPDDCYAQGATGLRPGSYRRSAVLAAAIQRASLAKLGDDIANGVVAGITLRGPDGLTLARDESRATVKLGPGSGNSSGPGFAVLMASAGGIAAPKFAAGVTRAGSTSRYRFSYVVAVALQGSAVLFARATSWLGQTWVTNPATGQLTDSEAKHHANDAANDLVPFMTPTGKDPSISDAFPNVSIDNSGVFVNTSTVPLNWTFTTLGIVLTVPITVTAQGVSPASIAP